MPNSLLVGIDVSADENKVRLLNPDGSSITRFKVPNNLPGAKSLSDKISGAMATNGFDSLVIALKLLLSTVTLLFTS